MFEIFPFVYLKELLLLVLTAGASIFIDFSSIYNEDNLITVESSIEYLDENEQVDTQVQNQLNIFDNLQNQLNIFDNHNEESAVNLGKALITLKDDKDSGILLLSKVLEEGNDASKQVAMATLVNHYYLNEQFFEVDSLLNMGIKITDNVLSSKLLTLQGDMRVNDEGYEQAIELYQGSIEAYPSPEVEFKMAQAYYKVGNNVKAKEIVESLLDNEKTNSIVRRKSIILKFKITND